MQTIKWMCALAVGASVGACGGTSQGDGNDDGDATDGVASLTAVDSDAPPTTGATSDDAADAGNGTAAEGPGPDDESDADSAGAPIVFDLGPIPDGGGAGTCQAGMGGKKGEPEFSYLWACNSVEGTISKIDTQTVTEIGRFYTRPDSQGSPSRTSVSLSGNVAVANRSGGITKIWALEEDCADTNGTPGIQTSTNNVPLAWDEEECRAWHIPFAYDSQRPVAWAPGEWNAATCSWQNEMLWTAGRYGQVDTEVVLIDGDAGLVLDTVSVPGLKADQYGLYGGAVDSEGNFWTTGWATGNQLVRVAIADMAVSVWPGPSSVADSHWYGMTVDVNGYVWNCASRVARFDPVTETWAVSGELQGGATSGCMADSDPDGLLWLGGNGVVGIDRETFAFVQQWPTPTSYGVSIDFFGYVWAVNGNGAHRVDPATGAVTSYNGLVGAYTYSDMTGYALNTVGGGVPSG